MYVFHSEKSTLLGIKKHATQIKFLEPKHFKIFSTDIEPY